MIITNREGDVTFVRSTKNWTDAKYAARELEQSGQLEGRQVAVYRASSSAQGSFYSRQNITGTGVELHAGEQGDAKFAGYDLYLCREVNEHLSKKIVSLVDGRGHTNPPSNGGP